MAPAVLAILGPLWPQTPASLLEAQTRFSEWANLHFLDMSMRLRGSRWGPLFCPSALKRAADAGEMLEIMK